MIHWPELLLIAGTDRNVGKTTFACALIEVISKSMPVFGIKISPHTHGLQASLKIIYTNPTWVIAEETNFQSTKDSSRMLSAGATRVFYIQTSPVSMAEIIVKLKTEIPVGIPVVCESSAMRDYTIPGVFVLMAGKGPIKKNRHFMPRANKVFFDFNFDTESFGFQNGRWYY